jgi:acyl carrier protein
MEEIIKVLREIHPERDYYASNDFVKDAILDSFDVVVLVKKLEGYYGITIDGEDITPENFRNITALNSLIMRYTNGNKL